MREEHHRSRMMGEDFSPELQWETLASMWWCSEFGVPIDLHTAASIGDNVGVQKWITTGADVNSVNTGGWTPLMYAAYLGHEDVCKTLLERSGGGGDTNDGPLAIDARSRDRNQTALMLASSCGNEAIVSLLLKHKASVNAVDNKNRSALHYATECNHAQVVRQLLVAGADANHLAELNGQYVEGYMTPFQLACAEGLEMIVQYFLQCGAADKNTVFDGGRSLAMKNGHTKIVHMIDSHGKGGSHPLEDKALLRKRSNVLDGPNAVSSLMKLQCNLASTAAADTTGGGRFYSAAELLKQQQQKDAAPPSADYEKTLTLEQYRKPENIEQFLELLQLTKYLPVFQEHDVDLDKLLTFSGDKLQDMGIKLFGPRKKILNAILRWNQNIPIVGISDSPFQQQQNSSPGFGQFGAEDSTSTTENDRVSLLGDYERTVTVAADNEQYPRPSNIDELMNVLQLSKYLPVFSENNVDLEKLLTLNGEELKEIGIKLFGPRKKILNAIERWHQNVPLTGIL